MKTVRLEIRKKKYSVFVGRLKMREKKKISKLENPGIETIQNETR